jgi:uncharacterized glyoxalase superfamily protein PhnB
MTAKFTPAVIPLRYVPSVDAVRQYYIDQLGFEHMMGMVGKDGQFDFSIVVRNGAQLMLARPQSADGALSGAVEIYVEVADVDGYHAELAGRNVEIADAPTTQWWGDRNFSVIDPAGHKIWFWKTVGEVQPPPGVTLV